MNLRYLQGENCNRIIFTESYMHNMILLKEHFYNFLYGKKRPF